MESHPFLPSLTFSSVCEEISAATERGEKRYPVATRPCSLLKVVWSLRPRPLTTIHVVQLVQLQFPVRQIRRQIRPPIVAALSRQVVVKCVEEDADILELERHKWSAFELS